ECGPAIEAYWGEIEALDPTARACLAIVESSDSPHVAANAATVARIRSANEAARTRLLHFTLSAQQRSLDQWLAGYSDYATRERLRSLLMPKGIAYSGGANKAALLASALGLANLHRRDSDTLPAVVAGAPDFASGIERRLLGRDLSELLNIVDTTSLVQP